MAENWIIPCNIKVFDIIAHFKTHPRVVWKNSFSIQKDDIAYIYIGQPYGEIRFKCLVVNDAVDDELLQNNAYAIPLKKPRNYYMKKEKYIELEFLDEYPEGQLTLERLRNHGLGQVQIQARTNRQLQRYLHSVEERLKHGGVV